MVAALNDRFDDQASENYRAADRQAAESRAEQAELELVKLRAKLAHAHARQKDVAQLLEHVSHQNAALRSELAGARRRIEELSRLAEDCELNHGWLSITQATKGSANKGEGLEALPARLSQMEDRDSLSCEARVALVEAEARRELLEMDRQHTAELALERRRAREGRGELEVRSRNAAAEVEHWKTRCSDLESRLSSTLMRAPAVGFGDGLQRSPAKQAEIEFTSAEVQALQHRIWQMESDSQAEKRLCAGLCSELKRTSAGVLDAEASVEKSLSRQNCAEKLLEETRSELASRGREVIALQGEQERWVAERAWLQGEMEKLSDRAHNYAGDIGQLKAVATEGSRQAEMLRTDLLRSRSDVVLAKQNTVIVEKRCVQVEHSLTEVRSQARDSELALRSLSRDSSLTGTAAAVAVVSAAAASFHRQVTA